jgi:hypothetical protein
MPIEIHELIIRAVVEPREPTDDKRSPLAEADRDALVQACVDETLRILRRERER